MLLNGVNHVAILTNDTERFVRFYSELNRSDTKSRGSQQQQYGSAPPGGITASGTPQPPGCSTE